MIKVVLLQPKAALGVKRLLAEEDSYILQPAEGDFLPLI